MAGGIDWFRWHHGSVTDPKFPLVAKRAGVSLPDVLAVWAYLLEAASSAQVRGQFGEVDVEALDLLFGFEDGVTAKILAAMESRNLTTTGFITAWDRRQVKRERDDTSTERVQKHRAKQAEQNGVTNTGTPCNTKERQETPREEKSREEESKPPQTPQGGQSVPDTSKSRGVRLQTFLDDCKAKGERPIRDYKPLWTYSADAKLPEDFVALAWVEFVRRHTGDGTDVATVQKDWRQKFLKYVQGNYYRLWAQNSQGEYFLTTQGKQAESVAEAGHE